MSSPRLCHGGIVADEMGLGKTLTALALIASTREEAVIFGERASAETQPSHAKTTLIVFPAVLRHEWESQIRTHFEPQALHVYSFHGPNKHTNVRDLATFDIVLISYDTLRNEIVLDSNRQFSQQTFSRVNWFRIILDEAHKIGSKSTKKMNAICTLQSQRRWCLTGTPIQNKIEDLGILYQFLRVAPFDDPRVFSRHIAKPLDVRKPEGQNAREAREKLRLLLNATVLRRTKKKVHLNLAPRTDQICYGCFTPSERHFYETCKEVSIKLLKLGLPNATSLGIILRLRQICNHKALLPKDFSHRLELYMNWKGHPAQAQEWTDTVTGGDLAAPELDIPESDTLQEPSDEHELLNPRNTSTKVKLLIERLLQTEFESKLAEHPIKSVVFSCWTTMLDVIELALKAEGIQYLRLDGKTSSNQRGAIIDAFQNGSDASVFLISINSGCTGLTLTAASRVHIMEPQWNPMVECQALDRVHRIGQDQDVVTIRYVMKDTIEESIHSYQRRKLDLINYTLEDKAISKDALLAYLTGHHDLFDS
ncbi:SNF2 family N-terminal domain-containing protein [Kalaharituber pfeilii]|nr:SNF2 family N-terminal domain-containing protein [Kalaharituber pfeilii]